MKKIIVASAILLAGINTQAQKVMAGRTFQLVSSCNSTISMSLAGNNMDMSSDMEFTTEVRVASVNGSTISGTSEVKHIKGKVLLMGQEQSFDSNDSSATANPLIAQNMGNLNKPENFTVVNGALKSQQAGTFNPTLQSVTGMDVAGKLFLPAKAIGAKENTSWEENVQDSSTTSEITYVVSRIGGGEIVITALTHLKTNNTVEQAGMEVKQTLIGIIKSIRTYNSESGTLKTDLQTIDMSGSNEMMGQPIPITIKGTVNTTVK